MYQRKAYNSHRSANGFVNSIHSDRNSARQSENRNSGKRLDQFHKIDIFQRLKSQKETKSRNSGQYSKSIGSGSLSHGQLRKTHRNHTFTSQNVLKATAAKMPTTQVGNQHTINIRNLQKKLNNIDSHSKNTRNCSRNKSGQTLKNLTGNLYNSQKYPYQLTQKPQYASTFTSRPLSLSRPLTDVMSINGFEALKIFDTTDGSEENTPQNRIQDQQNGFAMADMNGISRMEMFANSSAEMIFMQNNLSAEVVVQTDDDNFTGGTNELTSQNDDSILPNVPISSQVFVNENHLRQQRISARNSGIQNSILIQNHTMHFDQRQQPPSTLNTHLHSFQNSINPSQTISRQPSTTQNPNIPTINLKASKHHIHLHTGSSGSAYGGIGAEPSANISNRSRIANQRTHFQYPSAASTSAPGLAQPTSGTVTTAAQNMQNNYYQQFYSNYSSSRETSKLLSPGGNKKTGTRENEGQGKRNVKEARPSLLEEQNRVHIPRLMIDNINQKQQNSHIALSETGMIEEIKLLRAENARLQAKLANATCQNCNQRMTKVQNCNFQSTPPDSPRAAEELETKKKRSVAYQDKYLDHHRLSVESNAQIKTGRESAFSKKSKVSLNSGQRSGRMNNGKPAIVLSSQKYNELRKSGSRQVKSGEKSKRSHGRQSGQRSGLSRRTHQQDGPGMSPVQLFTLSSNQLRDDEQHEITYRFLALDNEGSGNRESLRKKTSSKCHDNESDLNLTQAQHSGNNFGSLNNKVSSFNYQITSSGLRSAIATSTIKGAEISSSHKKSLYNFPRSFGINQRRVVTDDSHFSQSQIDLSLSPSNCGSKFACVVGGAQPNNPNHFQNEVIQEGQEIEEAADHDQENLLPLAMLTYPNRQQDNVTSNDNHREQPYFDKHNNSNLSCNLDLTTGMQPSRMIAGSVYQNSKQQDVKLMEHIGQKLVVPLSNKYMTDLSSGRGKQRSGDKSMKFQISLRRAGRSNMYNGHNEWQDHGHGSENYVSVSQIQEEGPPGRKQAGPGSKEQALESAQKIRIETTEVNEEGVKTAGMLDLQNFRKEAGLDQPLHESQKYIKQSYQTERHVIKESNGPLNVKNIHNINQELSNLRLSPIKKFDLVVEAEQQMTTTEQNLSKQDNIPAVIKQSSNYRQPPSSARQIQSLEVSNFDVKAAAAAVGSIRNKPLNSSRNFFNQNQNQNEQKAQISTGIKKCEKTPNRYSIIEDQLNLENYVSQNCQSAREEPSSQKSEIRPNFFFAPENSQNAGRVTRQGGIAATRHANTETLQGRNGPYAQQESGGTFGTLGTQGTQQKNQNLYQMVQTSDAKHQYFSNPPANAAVDPSALLLNIRNGLSDVVSSLFGTHPDFAETNSKHLISIQNHVQQATSKIEYHLKRQQYQNQQIMAHLEGDYEFSMTQERADHNGKSRDNKIQTYRTSVVDESSHFGKTARLTMGAVVSPDESSEEDSASHCDVDENPREAVPTDMKQRYLSCASKDMKLVVRSPSMMKFKTFDNLDRSKCKTSAPTSKLERFKTDLRIDIAQIEAQYEEMQREEMQELDSDSNFDVCQNFQNFNCDSYLPEQTHYRNLAEQTLNLSKNLNQILSSTHDGDKLNESLIKFQLRLDELLNNQSNNK